MTAAPRTLDEVGLARLLREQDGVVARRQVLALGGRPHDVRRMVRRRELAEVLPGVDVDHTGVPTWSQRALRRDRGGPSPTIHVMVDATRTVAAPPGVTVERVRDAASWTQDNRRPPRARVELALLKSAAAWSEAGAVALLSDACHQGLTTPLRLLEVLEQLTRLPGRAWLQEVLRDVSAGTRSVLERRCLRDVERAHGLPRATRQDRVSTDGRVVYRDAHYVGQHTLVAATDGLLTLRPGWAQVLEPCRLSGIVARVLQARGWGGRPRPCGPCCPVDARGRGLAGWARE